MLSRDDILQKREQIIAIGKRYGADRVRLFGSVARGESEASSDVDFVVRFARGRSLLDQGGLLMDLRDLLGVNVDVISEAALHGRFKEQVDREAVRLWDPIAFVSSTSATRST